MKYLVILAVLFLTSCAMSKEEVALETQKLALMKAVADKPTLRCEQGCEYTDPRRNLAAMFPKETNVWDFANNILKTGIAVSPWLAVSKIAVDGLAAAGGNTTNTDSYNQSGGNTDTGAVDNSVTSGDVNSSTTDSNDNNSVTDSNDNNSLTDSNDDNSLTDSNDDNSVDDNSDNSTVLPPVVEEVTP